MEEPGLFGAQPESLLHDGFPWLVSALTWIGTAIELFAIAIMLIGLIRFAACFLRAELSGPGREEALNAARIGLGRYILAALEVFIVSDILETALRLDLRNLLFLALLVAIRSAISYFLEREIESLRERDGPPKR